MTVGPEYRYIRPCLRGFWWTLLGPLVFRVAEVRVCLVGLKEAGGFSGDTAWSRIGGRGF